MIKTIFRFTMIILPILMWGAFFTSCEDDKYSKIDDLFQPRFVLERPEVKSNSITMVWYKVNNAASYTVELHQDSYYKSLYQAFEITDPQIFIDDIIYGTTFYIRVRCNAVDSINNSQWSYTSASTEARPEYAKIVEDVSKTEISEESATIRWKRDTENPVDSISVMPMMDKTSKSVFRYLTEEEKSQGYAEIGELTKNTLYAVNLYDTSKPRKYDKPYNQVTLRTAGPSAASIEIGWDDDLTAILSANNENSEIPEGTEYFLPAGSSYRLAPFAIKKGFRLVGSTEGVKPIVTMEASWNMSANSYVSSLDFVNIEFRQEIKNSYFMNVGNSYTLENIGFVSCDFINFGRGLWRHQGANAKHVMNFEMEGCRIDQSGWQTGAYGTFHIDSFDKANSVSYDQFDRVIFRNCTFSRDTDGTSGYGWGNLFHAPNMEKPIHLEYKNISIYNYCRNQRMINIESAVGSQLVIEGMLLASPSGDLYAIGANTTTSFSNNYTTRDYSLGGSKMNATDLDITAEELFANPAAGDLTIKDPNSPVVLNRAGDTRWIP